MSQSVSIVIFAFNEERTIAAAIEEVVAAMERMQREYEIIVIDDGSTDATGAIADEASRNQDHVRVLHHPINRGFGGAVRSGLDAVGKDIVSFIAGDGQPIPDIYYSRCLPPLEHHDMVIGRLRKRRDPPLTLFLAGGERLFLKVFFPGVPKIEGPFMFRRSMLNNLDLMYRYGNERSWAALLEIQIRAVSAGLSYTIVDVERRRRQFGKSRCVTWGNAIRLTMQLLKLWAAMHLERIARIMPP